ncbi:unnamed protein product [Discosporangium mesarthrocarpum]
MDSKGEELPKEIRRSDPFAEKKSTGRSEVRMAEHADAIAKVLGGASSVMEIAQGIHDMVQYENRRLRDEKKDETQRASVVCGLAEQLFHEIKRSTKAPRGIVIFRSDLDKRMSYRDGGFIGTVNIGGYQYSIYAIYWGWIVNNGDRGYHNWCVHGYQRMNGNCINVDTLGEWP